MRKLLVILSILMFSFMGTEAQNVYYVQDTSDNSNASDNNVGTDINYPWATWQHAFDEAMPGDTVYFRGGTWTMNDVIAHRPSQGHGHQGTYENHICFFNYPGETPVIDFSNYTASWGRSGVTFEDPQYIELRGFIIENLAQPSDVQMEGLVVEHYGSASDPYAIAWFTNIEVRNIGGAGFFINGADTLVFKNCDSHDNFDDKTDPPGNHADGFMITAGGYPTDTAKVLIIDGCRAWNNSDDAFDFPFGQQVYISNTWIWNNGYQGASGEGIKPSVAWVVTNGKRVVKNCISAYNAGAVLGNLNLDDPYFGPRVKYINNVSYKDAEGITTSGFPWDAKTGIGGLWIYNNIIYEQTSAYPILVSGDMSVQARYIKDGCNTFIRKDGWPYSEPNPAFNVTDADFVSLDTAELRWPRKADGSLPDIDFMKLASNSDLIDGGCDVGLPYRGSAPDLGWYEYPSTVANGLYANAGSDQIRTDDDGSGNEMVILDGSGSEDDGNITSYVWTRNGSQIATGVNPKVSIPVGHNDIVLTVTDNDSNTATDTVNIWVQDEYTNQIPVANGGSDRTVYAPAGEDTATVHLDASASYDPDGTIVYYSWTYFDYHDDHSTHEIKNDAGATFDWRAPVDSEPYQVRLQVVDNNQTSVRDTIWVTVSSSGSNTPPTANAGTDQIVEDIDGSGAESINLDGSGTTAGSGTITSYVWRENNVQIATGINPTVSLGVGHHNIALIVEDDNSLLGYDEVIITVNERTTTISNQDMGHEDVLRSIPDSILRKIRNNYNMMYWHESHGTQIMRGLFGLEQYKSGDDTSFAISYESYAPNKMGVWDIYNDSSSIADAHDWLGQVTRDSLLSPNNADINVIMWAWCPFNNVDVPWYLDTMQVLINEFGEGGTRIGTGQGQREKPVNFIFMTGHAVGSGNTLDDAPEEAADSVNAFCERNGYYCLDFYSMDTHDMEDNYWDDATEDASSVKYHNAGGATEHFYQDWQDAHTEGVDWFYGRQSNGYENPGGGHVSQHISCNRKVYSLWWILARMAGWGGEVTEPLVANAGADQTKNDADNTGDENITLHGSFTGGEGTMASYEWKEEGSQIATGASPTVSFSVGSHTVTLTVTDGSGHTDDDVVLITITPYVGAPNDSIIIDSDAELVDSLTSPHRAAGDTIWVNYNPSTHHDFSISGTKTSPIIITSHPNHKSSFGDYQIVTGKNLIFKNINFNRDVYLQGDSISLENDSIRYEGIHVSGEGIKLENNVFYHCDTAVFFNKALGPILKHVVVDAIDENEVIRFDFPNNDYRGKYTYQIDSNTYNIETNTLIDGFEWSFYRASYPYFDKHSTFNVTE